MVAHPDFTFHVKESAQIDAPATATQCELEPGYEGTNEIWEIESREDG